MGGGRRRLVITILARAVASVSLVIGCVISVIYLILQHLPRPSSARRPSVGGQCGAGRQQQVEVEELLGVT